MYKKRLAGKTIDKNDVGSKIAAAIFNLEAVDPTFEVKDRLVRLKELTISNQKLTVQLEPISDK